MSNTILKRCLVICLIYTLLTFISVYSFEWFRHSIELNLFPKLFFLLLGPCLALFTHMSIFLFIPLTAIVLGGLMIWVFNPKLKWIAIAIFITLWSVTGWLMHDLF